MIPYSEEEWKYRLMIWGTVFELVRYKDGKLEHFILEPNEVILKELQDDIRSNT